MRNVLVIGDANVDIIVPYPRFLNEERTNVVYPVVSMQGGGTAANTAVALARLGIPTSFVGTIGNDQYGRFVRDDFHREHVNTEHLVCDNDLNTVGVFAFVDEYGERYLWGWPRVQQSFRELTLTDALLEQVCNADWVHSSGMILACEGSARESIIALFKQAYEVGVPTSFDLNLRVDNGKLDAEFAQTVEQILPYVTHLLGSGPEEFSYLGDGNWLENACTLSNAQRTVIARDSSRGSFGFVNGKCVKADPFHVEVVDTIGAGDVYNAGYIRAVLEGKTIGDALQEGNAVAAFKVAHKGARSSPTVKQLGQFLISNFQHNTQNPKEE